jgi:hypothetical protein
MTGTGAARVTVSRRLFVALSIVAALSPLGVAAAGAAVWQVRDLVHEEDREEDLEEAVRCIDQHDRVNLLRGAIERSTGRGAHAAATAVGQVAIRLFDPGDLPPDLLDQLGREADREAAMEAESILEDDYPDPTCDREAAERLLEEEGP